MPHFRTASSIVLCCALLALPHAAAQIWKSPEPARPQASPARAQTLLPRVEGTGDYLVRMDADADGKVSLLEYQDWLSYAFDNMDRNRDGVLAADEQPGGRGAAVTREQHRARLAETFKRQDRNRDGALDRKELAAPPQAK
jgi:EF hand